MPGYQQQANHPCSCSRARCCSSRHAGPEGRLTHLSERQRRAMAHLPQRVQHVQHQLLAQALEGPPAAAHSLPLQGGAGGGGKGAQQQAVSLAVLPMRSSTVGSVA